MQDYQGQRLPNNGVDWRTVFVWTVIVVSFCLLFQFVTYTLTHRIAAMILR